MSIHSTLFRLILLGLLALSTLPRAQIVGAAGVVGVGTPASCTADALAAAVAGGGQVTFDCGAAPHTIVLSSQLMIGTNTTLDGGTSGQIILSGGNLNRLFRINPASSLILNNLTLSQGNSTQENGGALYNQGTLKLNNSQVLDSRTSPGYAGGAIYNDGGTVVLEGSALLDNQASSGGGLAGGGQLAIADTVISNNSAEDGGGLYVTGVAVITRSLIDRNRGGRGGGIYSLANPLEIGDSTISNNLAPDTAVNGALGGGVYNGGRLLLNRVTVSGNTALLGGGLYQSGPEASLAIEATTFSGNRATTHGGGLYSDFGDSSLVNVTLSGNQAEQGGGGLYQYGGAATLANVTVSANQAQYGGGMYRDAAGGSSVTLMRAVLQDNTDGNCDGAVLSGGYNLADDTRCGLEEPTDRQNVDALLAPLASNGGPTFTHLPADISPALDAAPAQGCPNIDQRGAARPYGAGCDAGAVELNPAAAPSGCGGVFPVIADTTLVEADPGASYGAGAELRVSQGPGARQYTLLRFDLGNSLPPGSALHEAELELTLAEAPSPLPYTLEPYEVAGWDEATATWGAGPGPTAGYGSVAHTLSAGVLRIDVTTLANQWMTGEVTPATVAILPGGPDAMAATFVSREGAALPADAPRLVVRCAPPPRANPVDSAAGDAAQAADMAQLGQASTEPLAIQFVGGAVRYASFRLPLPDGLNDPLARAQWFLASYRDLLRVEEPDLEFQLVRQSDDGRHLFFRQRHRGIPVYPAELALHFDSTSATGLSGAYVPAITLPPSPTLPAERASELALAASESGSELIGETQLRYLSLDLLGLEGGTRLAWEVHLRGSSGEGTVFVDAHSGERLFTAPNVSEGYDLDLEDGNDEQPQELCDIWDNDNIDGNDALPDSQLAVDGFQAAHFYWASTHGRDSYDGDGEQMEVNIHVNYNPPNASYGVCDLFFFARGAVSNDIVGHEFTHAVDDSEGQLIYANQSGALDESFADIFGYFLDPGDWLVGEGTTLAGMPTAGVTGCATTPAVRDLRQPGCFGDPDHMLAGSSGDGQGLRTLSAGVAPNCGQGGNDCGFVHTNSGIHNKAAYLIIQGGTHNKVTVRAIGKVKAERLFFNVLVNRLWSSAQFIDARNAALAEAQALAAVNFQGFNSQDVCSVRNGYAAVGLGNGDQDCDGLENNVDLDVDGDWRFDGIDNCVGLFNPGQEDMDHDARGDACDPDDDNDGRNDNVDNCPRVANPGQADWNGDGIGDACGDADNDGQLDTVDNCRDAYNPDQRDRDFDGQGDVCDLDIDGDGRLNAGDNCPLHFNPGQEDTTEVGFGGPPDGVGDACDLCPGISSPDNLDLDDDGFANPCDIDDDGDGVLDVTDNCPLKPNQNQLDWDENGIGFACDTLEQAVFGVILRGLNARYVQVRDLRIPVPVCPNCSAPYLPSQYETVINVQLPINFQAQVVDSAGAVVAKGIGTTTAQTLRVSPRAFAATPLAGAPGMAGAGGLPLSEYGPDEMRYFLEIVPQPGTNLEQTYPLTLSVEQRATMLYLPVITQAP